MFAPPGEHDRARMTPCGKETAARRAPFPTCRPRCADVYHGQLRLHRSRRHTGQHVYRDADSFRNCSLQAARRWRTYLSCAVEFGRNLPTRSARLRRASQDSGIHRKSQKKNSKPDIRAVELFGSHGPLVTRIRSREWPGSPSPASRMQIAIVRRSRPAQERQRVQRLDE